MSRQIQRNLFRHLLFALAVAGFGLFSACQSNTDDGPEDRKFSFRDTTLTDLIRWERGSDTGRAATVPDGDNKLAIVHLDSPLGDDNILVSLWALGIRTTVITCVAGEGKTVKVVVWTRDTLGRALISLLVRSDSAVYPFTRKGATDLYARQLVKSYTGEQLPADTLFRGFPSRRPIGIDSAAVIEAAIVYLASKNVSFLAIGKTFLGIDSSKVHQLIQAMTVQQKITKKDSSNFFPPPPVRVRSAVALTGSRVVAGGVPVAIHGGFEADAAVGISAINFVIQDSLGSLRTEWFAINQPSTPTGVSEWDLAGKNVRMQAEATAKPGTYTLTVIAKDAKGKDSAASVTTFVVDPAPPVAERFGPKITLVNLSKDSATTVESDVTSYPAQLRAEDFSGVLAVYINDSLAVLSKDGVWSRTIGLHVAGAPTEIKIRAVDSLNNESSLSAFVTRKLPVGIAGPKVTYLGSSDSLQIPFAQKLVKLAWSIKDSVESVTVNGVVLKSTADTLYQTEVAIPASGEWFYIRLLAVGKNLMGTGKVVRVKRGIDKIAPVIQPDTASWNRVGSFQGDTLCVPTAATSLSLKWSVVDDGKLASVTLDGEAVQPGVDGLYVWNLPSVAAGLNRATVVAIDSAGNPQVYTLKVKRQDQVVLILLGDSNFTDVGLVRATSPTPGAIVEYSLNSGVWITLPDSGIRLTNTASITFRGSKSGFTDALVVRKYTVTVTIPEGAKDAIWGQFDWDDKLKVWAK